MAEVLLEPTLILSTNAHWGPERESGLARSHSKTVTESGLPR